ncbi:hypothetical protein GCM10010528_02530 [Gordonia defluvii]|uniref:Major facilitator superfamily (MFS) profile domain-containing protein n=1 Tax=Gordonia defluvii TaxID=283718 RepID=A0ABN3YB34_9ACTN
MSTESTTRGGTTRWWALALIATAQFMVIMDTSIIGVALPQMQADLGFTQHNLSWVFNAYVIALGGLLLLGGRLSDLFGARRMFATGWLVLLVGSLVAGLATNVGIELTGRAIQGAGSALIAPSALTLLMMIFGANPKELTKALALYGAAAPAGGTAGVFLGGVITEYISWPWSLLHQHPHRRRRSHRHPGPDARRGDGRPWLSRHLRSADRHSRPRCRGVRHRPCPRGRLGLRRDLDRSRRSRGPAGGVRGLPGRES